MKPSLFDCLFVVMYASVSVLANEESISNTTERSAKDKSSDKEDAKISICILLIQRKLLIRIKPKILKSHLRVSLTQAFQIVRFLSKNAQSKLSLQRVY